MPPPDLILPTFIRGDVKPSLITAPALSQLNPVRSSPFNDRRCYYYVENTGPNLGFFSWDEMFPGQTTRAIAILPGRHREWFYFIPLQAANFSSVLGTTFYVVEGWPHHG